MNKIQKQKAFTLIELMVVIAIIGILSSVVLVSTNGATIKAKKASAISTASSILPELVTCNDDAGHGIKGTMPTAGTTYICCSAANCTGNTNVAGHTATWPDVSKANWQYGPTASTGDINTGDYVFYLTPLSGPADTIKCDMAANGCS